MYLDPTGRDTCTEALAPPAGMEYDCGVALSYSLDPVVIIGLAPPLAGLPLVRDQRASLQASLRAIEYVAKRTSVFFENGRMSAPSQQSRLFPLLERMLFPCRAPRGGSFHAKLWLARYIDRESGSTLVRLVVPSRNLTFDNSWDVVLRLEGQPGSSKSKENGPVADLLRSLPSMVAGVKPDRARRAQIESLASDLETTVLELPEGFDSMAFFVHGTGGEKWSPPDASESTLVVSPFLSREALDHVAEGGKLTALVSRAEELQQLPGSYLESISEQTLSFAASGTTAPEQANNSPADLHAKILVFEKGPKTRLVLGSANATSSALLSQRNLEVLVELTGRTARTGTIADFLSAEGFGCLLEPWLSAEDKPVEINPSVERLEAARRQLLSKPIELRCLQAGSTGCQMELVPGGPVELETDVKIAAWPISVTDAMAVDAGSLRRAEPVDLGVYSFSQCTRLVAFRLSVDVDNGQESLAFTLLLPAMGMPEQRLSALVRDLLEDAEGFARYVLCILSEGQSPLASVSLAVVMNHSLPHTNRRPELSPILEETVKALAQRPEKLREVGDLLALIGMDSRGVVPPEFASLWGEVEKARRSV